MHTYMACHGYIASHSIITHMINCYYSELPVTTLRAALEEISGRVEDVECIFEVRREHIIEDCFENVTRSEFNPAHRIQVHKNYIVYIILYMRYKLATSLMLHVCKKYVSHALNYMWV